jgi:hypothetical protein
MNFTPPSFLVTTRFNQHTFELNCKYRARFNRPCIYCTPMPISSDIPSRFKVYVIEMNNTTNKIEGIGVILNFPDWSLPEVSYHECENNNEHLNRYRYLGINHINRTTLSTLFPQLEYIETALFTGKSHSKRGNGLLKFPHRFEAMQKHIIRTLDRYFTK